MFSVNLKKKKSWRQSWNWRCARKNWRQSDTIEWVTREFGSFFRRVSLVHRSKYRYFEYTAMVLDLRPYFIHHCDGRCNLSLRRDRNRRSSNSELLMVVWDKISVVSSQDLLWLEEYFMRYRSMGNMRFEYQERHTLHVHTVVFGALPAAGYK